VPLRTRAGSNHDTTSDYAERVKLLLNIIWLVLAGFWLAVGYALAGLVMFILIVTIPFGVQAFKLANFALWPFGRTMIKRSDVGGASTIGNVLWLVFAGWWLAIAHLVTAFAQAITIIGLPLAYANVKMIPGGLWPFGRELVRTADLTEAMRQSSEALTAPDRR